MDIFCARAEKSSNVIATNHNLRAISLFMHSINAASPYIDRARAKEEVRQIESLCTIETFFLMLDSM